MKVYWIKNNFIFLPILRMYIQFNKCIVSKSLASNTTAVIPCYNDGVYIMQALQSLYDQTLLPKKIIIVDDGSDVATKNILAAIKHPLVQIVHQENKGVSAARNNAIQLAQTDYIVNLDADDYFESTFIEQAVAILESNSEVVAVSSYHRLFKDSKSIEIIKPLGGNIKDFIVINNCSANTMFRKKCWHLAGGFDDKMLEGYEDWEFWIAILKLGGHVHILKEVLSHYRVKAVSRDQNALKNNDFELRQYIYCKHKEVYQVHLDFYVGELLRQNSLLRNSVRKAKNSVDYHIGVILLRPLRAIKKILKLK